MSDVESVKPTRPSRKNGFTWPLHPMQVTSWVVLLVFAVIFFNIMAPTIHEAWKPAAHIVSFIVENNHGSNGLKN